VNASDARVQTLRTCEIKAVDLTDAQRSASLKNVVEPCDVDLFGVADQARRLHNAYPGERGLPTQGTFFCSVM